VDSADVNEYLKGSSGQDFTAKEFRTWSGTVLMARALEELGASESEADAKRKLVAAVKTVAAKLGNKPATCRKHDVHPGVIASYSAGTLPKIGKAVEDSGSDTELSAEEKSVYRLIAGANGSAG
jgi:DNA topoisomerase-1